MDSIRGYIINITSVIFLITAVEMITPDNKIKKYVKFFMGLILISVIINPFVELLNHGSNIIDFTMKNFSIEDSATQQVMSNDLKTNNIKETEKVFESNIEKQILDSISTKFDTWDFSVNVTASYGDDYQIEINEVDIEASEKGVKTVEPVEINDANKPKKLSPKATEIINFINDELKIDKSVIKVNIT